MEMYKVSQSTGKMQVWSALSVGSLVITRFGQQGGKIQEVSYNAEPKNVGRSNATTGVEQAKVEVVNLYTDRLTNKHYRESEEEAKKLSNSCRIPRKIHNYKDHGGKMSEKVYSSRKVNGSRACVIDGNLYSKIGKLEEVKVEHIRSAIKKLGEFATFDAETYCHGLSLQRIRAAWTKPVRTDKEIAKVLAKSSIEYCPNADARSLELHIFDIPMEGVAFELRVVEMMKLERKVDDLGLDGVIKFIYPDITWSDSDRLDLRDAYVGAGYEGLVNYEFDDLYEFGKRSYTCQKDKPRYDAEAFVTDVESCKNGDGKLVMKACDALDNVTFKCMMKVERRDGSNCPRKVTDMESLIGKWVTFSYEELSDKGIPTKPVGELERHCNKHGEPLE
jgi:hypothetical protein